MKYKKIARITFRIFFYSSISFLIGLYAKEKYRIFKLNREAVDDEDFGNLEGFVPVDGEAGSDPLPPVFKFKRAQDINPRALLTDFKELRGKLLDSAVLCRNLEAEVAAVTGSHPKDCARNLPWHERLENQSLADLAKPFHKLFLQFRSDFENNFKTLHIPSLKPLFQPIEGILQSCKDEFCLMLTRLRPQPSNQLTFSRSIQDRLRETLEALQNHLAPQLDHTIAAISKSRNLHKQENCPSCKPYLDELPWLLEHLPKKSLLLTDETLKSIPDEAIKLTLEPFITRDQAKPLNKA